MLTAYDAFTRGVFWISERDVKECDRPISNRITEPPFSC